MDNTADMAAVFCRAYNDFGVASRIMGGVVVLEGAEVAEECDGGGDFERKKENKR